MEMSKKNFEFNLVSKVTPRGIFWYMTQLMNFAGTSGAHNLINAYDGQQSTHFSWWTMININAWWTMINNKVGK